MHLARKTAMGLALSLGFAATAVEAQSLTTTFAGGNGHYGAMFNFKALEAMTVDSFDVHFEDFENPAPCAAACSVVEVEVYHITGGGGFKAVWDDSSAWTMIGSVQHTVTTALGTPQPLSLPIGLAMGPAGVSKYGFYITSTGPTNTVTALPNETMNYTNGVGGGFTYDNGQAQIPEGWGMDYPFGNGAANAFTPRVWNGTVFYTTASGCGGATTYCTAGTSANGCAASLSATGVASASSPSGFVLTATNIEGNKDGLFFVGTSGQQANSWGTGTSFQCVIPPVKRFGILPTNGSNGNCDGTKTQDFNAYWTGFPSKNPGAGTVAQAQLWYRDPLNTSNQTTSLSDAIEFTLCP